MSLVLLWLLHLGFALAAFATALVWTDGASRGRRATAVGVALLPLLFVAYLTWIVGRLHFGLGIRHAPFRYVNTLLVAGALGSALLWRWGRRRGAAARWSRAGVTFGALGLLVAEAVLLSNLYTAVLQRLSNLRVEAGMLAYAALPPKPAPEENAAPLIAEATKVLHAVEPDDDVPDGWRRWSDFFDGTAPLDVDDPELAAFLAAAEPALALVRAAGERPRYQPAQEGDGLDWITLPNMIDVLDLGRDLQLSAHVHLARGEREPALADLRAMMRLTDHMLDTPTLLSTIIACTLREGARNELLDAWRRLELTPADVEGVLTGPRVLESFVLALRLEEAYGLSMLSRVDELQVGLGADFYGTRPVERLGMIFLFDAELKAYREVQAELRARVLDPEGTPPTSAEALRERGLAVVLLVPRLETLLTSARHSDARGELIDAALFVARECGGDRSAAEVVRDSAGLAARFPGVRFEPAEDGTVRLSATFDEADAIGVDGAGEPPPELVLSGSRLL